MEDSTFEAIYTGVYIFIFIAALTTTLYMFRNVNELAENSYEYGAQVAGQTLIEVPTETMYVLTGSDIVSYFFNNTYKDLYGEDNDDQNIAVVIKYYDKDIDANITTYNELLKIVDLDGRYTITCNSLNDGKYSYEINKK